MRRPRSRRAADSAVAPPRLAGPLTARARLTCLAGPALAGAALLVSPAALPAGANPAAATAAPSTPTASASEAAPPAGADARAWLAAADRALATRNYRGVFVHEYGGETETMRVVHRVGRDGLSERLQSMDGSGREFIRRGSQLICYLPDRHTVLVEKSPRVQLLMAALPVARSTLSRQYAVRQVGRARVSGRNTRVIAVVPMDQLRYGYQVWVDEATAMPLKMQLRTARGRVLEQIVFTDLTLPMHIAPSELAPSVDARHFRWVRQDDSLAAVPAAPPVSWRASALPPGFRMTVNTRQMLPGGPAEHLVFSDGLASVSVFVQRSAASAPLSAETTATLGSSSAYSLTVQGYRLTVVGQVPPQTVRRIAQAIRTPAASSYPLPLPQLATPADLGVTFPSPPLH